MTDRARAARRRAAGSVATVAHQERPDYLDRLAVLRDQIFVLDHLYMSVFSTAGWILRLGVTVVLLMSIHWTLALLVLVRAADGADLGLAARRRAPGPGGGGPVPSGRAAHLYRLATTAASASELRVLGHRRAGRGAAGATSLGAVVRAHVARARWVSAVWHTLAWTVFGLGYVAAVVYVASGLDASACGRCCSCSRPAPGCRATSARRSARSASCAASGSTARGGWPGSRTTRRPSAPATWPPPDRLESRHPLRRRLVRLPRCPRPARARGRRPGPARRGRWWRVVGENGAGKSTLVKLLAQMYAPDRRPDPRRRRRRSRHRPRAPGGPGWPAPSRTSTASSSPPSSPSASATCPRLDDPEPRPRPP